MTIMMNALKERIRRKELYIVVVIAVIILAFFGSDSATISMKGESITGFSRMFQVLHIVVNVAGCLLAMILSLQTIPTEYREKRSHLVWIRGIPQVRYHAQLAIANIVSSAIAVTILYLALAFYAITKGAAEALPAMLPGLLIIWINIAIISLLTSVLSICLPSFGVGLISSICIVVGVLHGILDIYKNIIGGFSGLLIKWVLLIFPDLNAIQNQASNIVLGNSVDIHIVLKGLLTLYIISLGLLLFRKKEA
ncbi:MAG: hypothetical protein ACRC3H_15545 [Lachnospiraceae bacterium]